MMNQMFVTIKDIENDSDIILIMMMMIDPMIHLMIFSDISDKKILAMM